MAGDAAECQPVVDARRHAEALGDLDRGEGDVVGVFQNRDRAAAIEGDVELARQAVEFAMMQDEMVQGPRMRARIEKLLHVDAGGRAAGDVADIVGARAARGDAKLRKAHEHLDGLARRDFAQLEIGARRHVGVAAGAVVGEIGKACELMRRQDAAGDAQPAHEGVLRWRDVEQAFVFREEDIRPLGEDAGLGGRGDRVPAVQRAGLAFRLFLGRELAACRDLLVLSDQLRIGGGCFAWRLGTRRAVAALARGDAGHEAFEVVLLVGRETGHRGRSVN